MVEHIGRPSVNRARTAAAVNENYFLLRKISLQVREYFYTVDFRRSRVPS